MKYTTAFLPFCSDQDPEMKWNLFWMNTLTKFLFKLFKEEVEEEGKNCDEKMDSQLKILNVFSNV